jgi:hypothetical protein
MESENITVWEYLILQSFLSSQPDSAPSRFELRSVNGKRVEKTRDTTTNTALIGVKMEKVKDYPFLDEYLQELGKQGWEVCASSVDSLDLFLILKRPVPK